MSDNGPQFTGQPFKDMCRKWSITHKTSSPHYPRSNGLAERMVRTVKSLLKKCAMTNQDPLIAMLHLRATPVDSHMKSPAEILFGRPIRTTLPSHHLAREQSTTEHLLHRQTEMKGDTWQTCGERAPPTPRGTTSTCSTSQGTYLDSCESLQSVRRAPVIRDLHPQRCCTSAQPFSPEGNPCQQCTHWQARHSQAHTLCWHTTETHIRQCHTAHPTNTQALPTVTTRNHQVRPTVTTHTPSMCDHQVRRAWSASPSDSNQVGPNFVHCPSD